MTWKKATATLADGRPFSRPGLLHEYPPPFRQQLDSEAAAPVARELRDAIRAAVQDALTAVLLGTSLVPDERARGKAVLEARNLCKSFGRGPATTPILKNVDLQILSGEFVALIGPSGSGKSTLLSILGLLEPPTSGHVLINQQSATQLSRQQLARFRGRTIGYVFQSFNLLAGLSVVENVMLPGLLAGESGRAGYDRAITLLEQFDLASFAKRVPAELSGGQQQRVAIARALFMKPDVILADEPTGNLDTKNGLKVIEALEDLNSSGQTIVLVTHDRSISNDAPRRICLRDGRIETDSGSTKQGPT
jgi:putative ABC transport system ATP-binding protein